MEKKLLDLQAVLANVHDYTNRERAVRMDGELSETGKNARLKQLASERLAYRETVVRVAVAVYDGLLARFDKNDERRKAAQNDAAEAWDYERLNYQARAAETRVKLTADIASLERLYEAALNSGDKHALRAFCEVAAGEVRAHWLALEPEKAHLLVKRMERDLEQLLTSPELKVCNTTGAALAEEALELKGILRVLHREHGGAVSGWMGLENDDELGWMINSIRDKVRMMDDGSIVTDIEILPWRAEREKMRGSNL